VEGVRIGGFSDLSLDGGLLEEPGVAMAGVRMPRRFCGVLGVTGI
jgi:hypothetical protein